MRYQPDHLIDLIVRAMEDELAARHQSAPEGDGTFGRPPLEEPMHKYLIAAALIVGFAAPEHSGQRIHSQKVLGTGDAPS